MARPRTIALLLGAAAAAIAVVQRSRGAAAGRTVPGGILIGDAGVYDMMSRLLLGPFFASIAADVAAGAKDGARVLEVGCGPGQLSIRLARRYRPGAAAGRSGAHLGFQARRPAAPLRTAPRASAGSGRTRARLSASRGERDALALALEVQPRPADGAGLRRWRTRALGNIA